MTVTSAGDRPSEPDLYLRHQTLSASVSAGPVRRNGCGGLESHRVATVDLSYGRFRFHEPPAANLGAGAAF
jgi:hypothetical protein